MGGGLHLGRRLQRAPRATLGFAVLALVFGVYGLVFTNTLSRLFGPGGETVTAVFTHAKQLGGGSEVRVEGIEMGKVDGVELDEGARTSTVRMTVFDDAMPLYRNATAKIQWRTALGGSFVVSIDRGDPSAGELVDRRIPVQQTTNQVELEDVTSIFQGEAVAGLRSTLSELPRAFRDADAPRRVFEALGDAAPDLERGVRALRGAQDGDLRALVANTADAVAALDTPEDAIHDIVQGGARTAHAVGAREAKLRESIRRSTAVMRETRGTLARLRVTLGEVDPLVAALRDPAGDIAPTARALRPTLTGADALLADARPVVRSLRPAASALGAASEQGLPLLEELLPALRRTDERILPGLAKTSPESKHKTYEMIGPTLASLLGAGASFDAEGHYARLFGSASDRALDPLPCRGFLADKDSEALLNCQMLQEFIGRYFGLNGGPRP